MEKKDEYKKSDPYDVNFKNYFHRERLRITLEILKDVSNNSKILDVGCGKGYFTNRFNINDNEVLGIDYSEKAIKFANEHFSSKSIKFKVNNVEDLNILKRKFDIIIGNNLIEHIDNVNQFFKDCHGLLKDNGYFIISTPNIYSFKNLITNLFLKRIKYRSKYHVCEYSKPQIRNFCLNNNFRLIRTYPQYQFKPEKKGLKYRFFNAFNFVFKVFNLYFFASTYHYLIKKQRA